MELPEKSFIGDLSFPEAPRWRAGQLWFSDMVAKRLCTADPGGTVRTVARFDEMPGGVGFLPDGTPLVVGMSSARVFAVRNGEAEVYAELGDAAAGHCDDMVVSPDGTAYVGAIGEVTADMEGAPAGGGIVSVTPDGQVIRDADELAFPNGAVVTNDGRLLVNETFAERITAFDIDGDGRLTNRRTWAELPRTHPDGIAVDADGAVWVGCYLEGQFVRVLEGGEITDVITTGDRWATGVELGGLDGKTLFLCTADTDVRRFFAGDSHGRIDAVNVDVGVA
ncbi:SMP-30/gluconolactonase/LRE family protein [Mycobacterium sp.]|uniref:SMP-30/gluconolactonase/LRE family protein n=1 Tax=Mycobacterium sp. TaxID=1785 RepID=UPI0011F5C1B1|nr:SMP-30/gluconolactonase/LRE family protein [Mycobacterium sp.]TAM64517.1 MAG: gluconolaconase [Mycobacterium sp.]